MCTEARQKAIQGIESHNLDPIQKLVLADAFDIPQWLMPSYIELCKRDNPLTPDDALWIGPEKAMSIAKARESIRGSPETRQMFSGSYYGSIDWPSGVFENSRVERIVNEALVSNIPSSSPTLPCKGIEVNLESVGAVRVISTFQTCRPHSLPSIHSRPGSGWLIKKLGRRRGRWGCPRV